MRCSGSSRTLAEGFRHDAVNLVVAHSYIAGAKSLRARNGWSRWATSGRPPPKPCRPPRSTLRSGISIGRSGSRPPVRTPIRRSPMQLDFGEVDDEKSFVVIEVAPGKPPRVERVPYQGAAELGTGPAPMTELERDADTLRHFGFLKVRITLDAPMPDLNRRAVRSCPTSSSSMPCSPNESAAGSDTDRTPRAPAAVAPLDQFRTFYRREHQREPLPDTLTAFSELYADRSQE